MHLKDCNEGIKFNFINHQWLLPWDYLHERINEIRVVMRYYLFDHGFTWQYSVVIDVSPGNSFAEMSTYCSTFQLSWWFEIHHQAFYREVFYLPSTISTELNYILLLFSCPIYPLCLLRRLIVLHRLNVSSYFAVPLLFMSRISVYSIRCCSISIEKYCVAYLLRTTSVRMIEIEALIKEFNKLFESFDSSFWPQPFVEIIIKGIFFIFTNFLRLILFFGCWNKNFMFLPWPKVVLF